jgi:hypothetical protein
VVQLRTTSIHGVQPSVGEDVGSRSFVGELVQWRVDTAQ